MNISIQPYTKREKEIEEREFRHILINVIGKKKQVKMKWEQKKEKGENEIIKKVGVEHTTFSVSQKIKIHQNSDYAAFI